MKAFEKVAEIKKVLNTYLDQMIKDLEEDGVDLDDIGCLDEDLGSMLQSALEDCEM